VLGLGLVDQLVASWSVSERPSAMAASVMPRALSRRVMYSRLRDSVSTAVTSDRIVGAFTTRSGVMSAR
jgi:hypothetical protein